MNILLVYPAFSESFWRFTAAMKFVDKKAPFPPLGLPTVAAMLPEEWGKRLVNINVQKLTEEDIRWADYVFISAMVTQKKSTVEVISRCNELGVSVVLGGPILDAGYEDFGSVKHFFLGEAENTLPEFLRDLQAGRTRKIYSHSPGNFPDITTSPPPIPLWRLINTNDYASMLVQYGRGCPFNCYFCNIGAINGHKPRTKTPQQFIKELEAIYATGFRGAVFVADDNIISNKKTVKEMLRQVAAWQQNNKWPFEFTVEADITLSDDDELMDLMVLAGVKKVFLGLETPNEASLAECGKVQNMGRDLVACVKKIQKHGLIPLTGLIVGFDADDPKIFVREMINFVQDAGIVIAMISVLQAQPGTRLYDKLKAERRLYRQATDNTDCESNFATTMSATELADGYRRIVQTIYSPRYYYERIRNFLEEYNTNRKVVRKVNKAEIKGFVASLWRIGLFGGPKVGYYYWKALLLSLFKYRKAFPEVVSLEIYGCCFRKFVRRILNK